MPIEKYNFNIIIMDQMFCRKINRAVCDFFFQAEDGIRDIGVTGVQTCALPIGGRVLEGEGCGGGDAEPLEGLPVGGRVGLDVADLVGEHHLVEELAELEREKYRLDVSLGALVTSASERPRRLPSSMKSTRPGSGSSSGARSRKLDSWTPVRSRASSAERSGSRSLTIFALLRPLMFCLKKCSSISTPWGRSASAHVGRCSESVSASVPSRSKSRARYKP